MLSAVLWILAGLLVAAGLAGLVLPGLPGAPLLFVGLLLAAWIEDFAHVGAGTLVILGFMAAATYAVELAATAFGSRRFGASPQALWGAMAGGLIGLFFGLVGVLVGPFLGAVVGELWARGGWRQAGLSGVGASVGLAIGVAGKVALGSAMIGLFVLQRLLAD